MGFYLRKSKKIGPFRLNLSKSGLGVSAGVTGMRVSRGPRGAMIHMGRHGVYYRKSLNSLTKPGNNAAQPKQTPSEPSIFLEIDSGSTAMIVDATSQSIVDLIRSTRRRFRLVWLSLPVLVPAFWEPALLLVGVIAAAVLGIVDTKRRTAYLAYDINDDMEGALQRFYDTFERVFSSKKVWNVVGRRKNESTKTSGGAGHSVEREAVTTKWGVPSGVKTNVRVPSLPVGRQTLYFMPDMVLIDDRNEIGAVSYQNLGINERVVQVIEHDDVPADAEVVGRTWMYVNKDGGPDRRYKNNRELPICNYLEIAFSSESGLNEVTQVSDAKSEGAITEALTTLAALLATPTRSEGA